MKKIFLVIVMVISSSIQTMDVAPKENKKHIVYHPDYDMTFIGFEKVIPFESSKYGNIANALITSGTLTHQDFHQPQEITDKDLLLVHTEEYLHNVHHCASAVFTKASEVPVFFLPNFLVRWKALYPMRLATGGTVEATKLALKNQWAINLSGGYHHAKTDDCSGFCIYNDAAIAAHKAITEDGIKKILVIDLDAHQGNGNEEIFGSQPIFKDKVIILDRYVSTIYPGRSERHFIVDQKTWYNYPIATANASEVDYLILRSKLTLAIQTTQPELIIYNAGIDILTTKEGIIQRDAYIFKLAKKKNIPIIMMLSGDGYTQKNAGIIADSIKNIFMIMEGY